jgi:hypothetical protein
LPDPPAALSVVSVEIVSEDPTDLHLKVFFNTTEEEPLVYSEEFLPGKWTARRNDVRFHGGNVTWFDFNCLEVALQNFEADAGEDELNYSNAPSDVSDSLGRMLAAFTGFPL